ncbi:Presenilin homolog [Strongyloides ratti]|uniref:Presenilin homolog n=1 Tax=Strongyloides ratti TaxID=34506 RepID=A0A090MXD6_STRRB|nr:Presenilin homolog [Strongyloides ratti]CEF65249.1 Presenilin homolog [Strongyloides ratti]
MTMFPVEKCSIFKYNSDVLEKAFRPGIKMFLPVLLNMILTLLFWIGLYDMKQEKNNPFNLNMLSTEGDFTTGNQIFDGIINAFSLIFLIGLVSFGLLALAIYEFKNVIQGWLAFSLVSVLFGVFSIYIYDFLKMYNISNQILLTIVISSIYGTIGCFVFFTKKIQLLYHQIYTIINCAMVSVLYLRSFPESTIWYVLPTTLLWDIFAVWSPFGPLKRVTEKAYQYNESILKFMMFTADNINENTNTENDKIKYDDENSLISSTSEEDELNDSISTNNDDSKYDYETSKTEDYEMPTEIEEEESVDENTELEYLFNNQDKGDYDRRIEDKDKIIKKNKRKMITAMDALSDDNSVRLGLGDFIFYSLLVGKSAVDMSIMATTASIFAILLGLLITLIFLQKGDIVVPALPIPIFLGIIFHFGTLYFIEPFIKQLYRNYIYLL